MADVPLHNPSTMPTETEMTLLEILLPRPPKFHIPLHMANLCNLKESFLVEVAKYATSKGIAEEEPTFKRI